MHPSVAEHNEKLIPAWLQPVTALDLLAARGINNPKVFFGTGLFAADQPFAHIHINPDQFNRLLENGNKVWPSGDFCFQLGHQLARTGLGQVNMALTHKHQPALVDRIIQYQTVILPSISIRPYHLKPHDTFLLMGGSTHLQANSSAVRVAASLLAGLCKRQLSQAKLDLYITEATPVDIELFDSLVPAKCHYNMPFNGLRVRSEPTDESSSDSLAQKVILLECDQLVGSREYLLNKLQKLLWPLASEPMCLLTCAATLETSPATLKRRLAEAKTSFQAVQDQLRMERSVIDLLVLGASADQIGSRLHFHDSSNFRRAFKRWTGMTPSSLKRAYGELFSALG